MFYCTPCAKDKGWPNQGSRSAGPCEICGRMELCHNVKAHLLPIPGLKMESDEHQEALKRIRDHFGKAKEEDSELIRDDGEFTVICGGCEVETVIGKGVLKENYDNENSTEDIGIYFGSCGGYGFISFQCNKCHHALHQNESDF